LPLTPEELAKVVAEYQDQCDAGHRRLRDDLRDLHDRTELAFGASRARVELLSNKIDTVAQTPPDVMKLRFSSGVVVSIIFVTMSAVGASYGISSRVTNRIDAMAASISEQSERDKLERAAIARLSDERNGRYERAIDTLTRQIEALKFEQQRLREAIK
jgi:hypothetical protein